MRIAVELSLEAWSVVGAALTTLGERSLDLKALDHEIYEQLRLAIQSGARLATERES